MKQIGLVTIILAGVCFGQLMILPWERYVDRINEDILTDVCEGYGFGSIAVGTTFIDENIGNTSILVHRYSNSGVEQWSNWQYSIPNAGDCAALSVCKLGIANDYIIAGNHGDIYTVNCHYGFILKLDESGVVEDYETLGWALSARDVIEHNANILVAGMHEAALGQSYIPQYYVALFNSNLSSIEIENYGYTEGDEGYQQENLCLAEYNNSYIIAGGTGYNSDQMYRYGTITLLSTSGDELSVIDHIELQYDACMDIEVNGANIYALIAPYRSWPYGHSNTEVIIAKYNIINNQLVLVDQEEISPLHIYNNWFTEMKIVDNEINIYGNTDIYGEYKMIHVICDMSMNYINEFVYSYGGIWPVSYGRVGATVVEMPNRDDQVAVTLARSRYTTQDRYNTYAYCVRGSVSRVDEISEHCMNDGCIIGNDINAREIYITAVAEEGSSTVAIYDMNGRKVITKQVYVNESGARVSYDELPLASGIYIITIENSTIQARSTIMLLQ